MNISKCLFALVAAMVVVGLGVGLWVFHATESDDLYVPTYHVGVSGYTAHRLMDSVVVLPREDLEIDQTPQPRVFVYFGSLPTTCVILPDGRQGWLSVQPPDEKGQFDFERPQADFWEDDCGFVLWSEDERIRLPVIEPMRMYDEHIEIQDDEPTDP